MVYYQALGVVATNPWARVNAFLIDARQIPGAV